MGDNDKQKRHQTEVLSDDSRKALMLQSDGSGSHTTFVITEQPKGRRRASEPRGRQQPWRCLDRITNNCHFWCFCCFENAEERRDCCRWCYDEDLVGSQSISWMNPEGPYYGLYRAFFPQNRQHEPWVARTLESWCFYAISLFCVILEESQETNREKTLWFSGAVKYRNMMHEHDTNSNLATNKYLESKWRWNFRNDVRNHCMHVQEGGPPARNDSDQGCSKKFPNWKANSAKFASALAE